MGESFSQFGGGGTESNPDPVLLPFNSLFQKLPLQRLFSQKKDSRLSVRVETVENSGNMGLKASGMGLNLKF